jgi:DNA replication and repair protein RecF
MPAAQYASEGQQRTIALALKIAQARVFATESAAPPLLLIDDIFGELDLARRNRLLRSLPADAQRLVTATSMTWHEGPIDGPLYELSGGSIQAKTA